LLAKNIFMMRKEIQQKEEIFIPKATNYNKNDERA